MMNFSRLIQTSIIFFFILDSLGNIPIFIASLRNYDEKRQRQIIWREMFIALGVMILFFFFGKSIWTFLNIDTSALNLAGGVILFLIGIKLTLANPNKKADKTPQKEPLIVPLAIPAVAGPGILAAISLYSAQISSQLEVFLALFLAWVASLPVVLSCSFLKKYLKDFGIVAIERLMGLIVILLGVDMFLKGIVQAIVNS